MPDVVVPVLDEAEAIGDVVREEQRGFGAACWAGLVAAEDRVACFMDGDGSLDPAHRAGWRITEVDVPYAERSGRSKVTGTVRGTLRTVRDMGRILSDG